MATHSGTTVMASILNGASPPPCSSSPLFSSSVVSCSFLRALDGSSKLTKSKPLANPSASSAVSLPLKSNPNLTRSAPISSGIKRTPSPQLESSFSRSHSGPDSGVLGLLLSSSR
ncbi:hypothetical protein LB505_013059 [Fusarium chuoi]|nr:hypothetical protein LB505_013059 [Fusarium chuoi]